MELPIESTAKPGIRIEKPVEVRVHSLYPILLIVSALLIVATAWLLVLEYLGDSPPTWLKSVLEDFVLTL